MNIYSVIRLIIKQIKWLVILPMLAGCLMYLLTINQPQTYSTKATLFTAIASSSSLNDLGNNRVDFFATKAAYNNLITIINSRHVIEETSIRLLALHLMQNKPNPAIISETSYYGLQEILTAEIKELVDYDSYDRTYNKLAAHIKEDKNNFIYGLINFDHPHYSYKAISSIKTNQLSGSDIIELSYQSNDPAIAYHTLNILIEVFLKIYGDLKINQTNAVIGYFEKQLNKASNELNNAEDRLLKFNKTNQIINYYEQTKHISSQQEKIEIKLQDIMLEYEAAEAVLSKLESETQSRFNINLKNKEIIDLRESLIVVNKNLAELDIKNEASPNLKQKLVTDKTTYETRLKQKIDSLYIYERHSDGIAIETLLNDWLKNVIEFESAKARLLAIKVKNQEFKKLYNQYAPLGAILKRIEREIHVKEKAYLEILHHLGLARLKQQNEEMMANMKLLDEPYLPIEPEPNKRKVFIIVIAVFTFLLVLLGFFVFELLDRTIKTPKKFEQLSSIKVFGVLPLISSKTNIEWKILANKGTKVILESILNTKLSKDSSETIFIQIISHFNNEGKSHIAKNLYSALEKLGYEVGTIGVNDPEINSIEVSSLFFANNINYNQIKSDNKNIDIVIVEVPPLSSQDHILNPMLIKSSDLHFIVADASRTWSETDHFLLKNFREHTNISPIGILNKTNPENMEELVGEIPKSRSLFRKYIKQNIFKKYLR